MEKIIKKIKNFGIIETIVFVIYIVIIMIIATNHECYEDETQSWIIARDLNIIEIIAQMKYEGHSFLWYYIIAPFAKLGFPVITQVYITSFFGVATVYIILKKSPFNKLIKILLTFSGGMIYFYSVIARPYCLIPFLLACISVIYKDRKKCQYLYATLIALLANTHLVMLPTAGLLTLMFWGEEFGKIIKYRKKKLVEKEEKIKLFKSFLIALLGILIFCLIAIYAKYNCEIVNNYDKTKNVKTINSVFRLIKDTSLKSVGFLYGSEPYNVPRYFSVLVGIAMILCVIATPKNLKQAIIFWSQLLFTILVHSFSWFILATRIYIIIYTLMFWVWNYKEDEQYKKKTKRNIFIELALVLIIILSIPSAYNLAYQDIIGNFSTGKVTAEYIKNNIPENSCFICTDNELQQSVIAYLPKGKYQFYMPNSQHFITFITWDKEWNKLIEETDIDNAIKELEKKYNDIYIISSLNNISMIKYGENMTKIYSSTDKLIDNFYVRNEVYNIYEIIN